MAEPTHPITYPQPDGAWLQVTDNEIVPLGEEFAHRQLTYGWPGGPERVPGEAVFEIRDGVPLCVSLRLWSEPGDQGVRTADLEMLVLKNLMHDAFAITGIYRPNPQGPGLVATRGPGMFIRDRKVVEAASKRRKVTPALLRQVAEIHSSVPEGERIKAIRNAFDPLSESQAKRYIRAAREEGLIK
ncbi:MAG: hypothetical protein ACKOI2_09735 [Actinomycetota bacterium]